MSSDCSSLVSGPVSSLYIMSSCFYKVPLVTGHHKVIKQSFINFNQLNKALDVLEDFAPAKLVLSGNSYNLSYLRRLE